MSQKSISAKIVYIIAGHLGVVWGHFRLFKKTPKDPKRPQNDPKIDFFQTSFLTILGWFGVILGCFERVLVIFGPRNAFKWPYLGSKMAQKWAKNHFSARSAKRAQAREALEVWRICEPRSGSPMKERSRLRECDAHPEGIITMRLASRPIDVCMCVLLYYMNQKIFEFCLFLSPGPSIPLAMSTHKILSPNSSPIFL